MSAFNGRREDGGTDLSAEIIRTIARAPDERVTCRRIDGSNYRCNWWGPQGRSAYDNPGMGGLLVTTHRVRRSAFFRVTETPEGLSYVSCDARPESSGRDE
jgi:hypothetical protein